MDRRDEETRVWPSAGTDPPAGDEQPPEAPLSLWARLWNFFTVEVPDEPDPDSERPPHGRAPASDDDAPGTTPPATETTISEVGARRRTASPDRPLPGRSRRYSEERRYSRTQAAPAGNARRRRWAVAAVALGVAAAAWLAVHAGRPLPPANAGEAVRPAPHAAVHPGQAAPSPAPPAQAAAAPGAEARSTPDCASMDMQPVAPPGSPTSPSVPGLCFSLGGGSGWLIGCAPGFQTACDPRLQTAIACVRQDGARHRGVVTEADVRACDIAAADASQGAGASPPIGRAPPGNRHHPPRPTPAAA